MEGFCALSADILRVKAHLFYIYRASPGASQRQTRLSCKLLGRAFGEALKGHKKGMTCRSSPSYMFVQHLFEKKLSDCCNVVTAVHPCMSAARVHCLVLDSSVLEVLLKLERRLVEEV